ncbi:hypothetical protein DXG03_002731 [Asterophora parasitica]|uniref:Uncharacterized protein n=1 Tax=Asterophora parasitica TaxID=117018 RepID=A0A9P7KC40_9AGAR|nr:hypothetical protein DXG03_002731 [Asterophora parasitica]
MVFDSPSESPYSLLLSDLLDARFPAKELIDLDLVEHNEIEVRDIEHILRRSPKLRTFLARMYWLNPEGTKPTHLDLPHLRSLVLYGHYPRYRWHIKRWDDADANLFTRPTPLSITWSMLYHLDTGNITFDLSTLCVILRQCTALMTFPAQLQGSSMASESGFPTTTTERPTLSDSDGGMTTLPMISEMKLKLADGYLLDRLLLPRLRYLKISHTHLTSSEEPPLVVPEIISLLNRSGCILLTLSLSGHVLICLHCPSMCLSLS